MNVLTLLNIDLQMIKEANIKSESENLLRKQILASYRGYGMNEGMFENFPNITQWVYGECDISDIDKIHYINYSYWNELSKNTGLPRVAAQTINEGHSRMTVYGLIPEKFDQTHCYIGKCKESELRGWDGK